MGSSLKAQRECLKIFLRQWETALDHNCSSGKNEVHISCDMNIDALNGKWFERDYHLFSLAELIHESCNVNNFSQLVDVATRLQYNSVAKTTSISCIDHIYTNSKHRCSRVTVIPFGSSDHDVLYYTRYSKDPPQPARTIRKRSYKDFSAEKFLADVANIDWTDVLCTIDLDYATELFTWKLVTVLDLHAPWVVYQQRKHFAPWITDEIKNLMKHRDLMKKKAKDLAILDSRNGIRTSTEQQLAWSEFKRLRNKVNNKKKIDEQNFKSNKLKTQLNNPSQAWSTVKNFMGWKSIGSPNQLEVSGRLITKSTEIAGTMNSYFIEKVLNLRNGLKKVSNDFAGCLKIMQTKQCSLSLNHVSIQLVLKLLKGLKSSKSTSVDQLDNYAVKLASDFIARPVHHLITMSLMQQRFPSSWKYSKLIPLHKKDSMLEPKNYRPVAILSPISKILEKVVFSQLYGYFTSNKILHKSLHGYRKNRSTLSALLQMYNQWIQAASSGQTSGVVFLDLSAAFDLVDSKILIEKLKIYGVKDDMLEWVKSYMNERFQAVWVDSVMSDFVGHSLGVPQGSILGPLLFLIYYNDLPSILDCNIEAYADDSTLSVSAPTNEEIRDRLNENCKKVVNWMPANHFKLNAGKTHHMKIGTDYRVKNSYPIHVVMDGVELQESSVECLLGCHIQSNLKWHAHIENLIKKLKLRLAGLSSLRQVVSYHFRNTLALGLFNSVLIYCLPLFGGTDKSEINKLQVLQNKAAQFVLKCPPRTNRKFMYQKLDWLTLNQLISFHTLLNIFNQKIWQGC